MSRFGGHNSDRLNGLGLPGLMAIRSFEENRDERLQRTLELLGKQAESQKHKALLDTISSFQPGQLDPNQFKALQALAQMDPKEAAKMYAEGNNPMRGSDMMDDAMMWAQQAGIDPQKAAALFAGPMVNQWRQPRGPSTQIVMPPGDKKYDQLQAQQFWDEYNTAMQGRNASEQALNRNMFLQQLLSGQQTGPLTGMATKIASMADQLGLDVSEYGLEGQNPRVLEAARALGQQVALGYRNPAGGEGMPGHLSNQDRKFLVEMVPGPNMLPQARELLYRFQNDIARHQIEYAAEWSKIQAMPASQMSPGDKLLHMQEWKDNNSIFMNRDGTPTDKGRALQEAIGGTLDTKVGDQSILSADPAGAQAGTTQQPIIVNSAEEAQAMAAQGGFDGKYFLWPGQDRPIQWRDE